MAAWMLPTDDHSFFEIMLGGEPYVAAPFRMALGLEDLGQLWPPNATLQTADGHAFAPSELWAEVGRRLGGAVAGRDPAQARPGLSLRARGTQLCNNGRTARHS